MSSETPLPHSAEVVDGQPPAVAQSETPAEKGRRVVRALGGRFGANDFPSGTLAELRRLDPNRGADSAGPTFWRIVVEDLEDEGLVYSERELRLWMALLQGLATLAGFHDSKVPLGRAIAAAGVSELRFTRLLSARGDALLDSVRALAHQLRSKGQSADWSQVHDLLISDGQPWADSVRMRIASDFYRGEHRKKKESQADD